MIKQANNATYNVDKLPLEVVGILNFLFKGETEGFENAYMVEIKLDDPIKHIEDGDEFFIIHASIDEYQIHAEHRWKEDWAVVHKSMFKNLTESDSKSFETLLKKYFETGELSKKKDEKKTVRQRRR